MTLPVDESFRRLATLEERGRSVLLTLGTACRRAPPPLPPEPDTKDFYLYGVLGAKNVGKSSLVASLLGVEHVPEEGRELGEGTRRPRVFASPALLPRVIDTLERAGVEAEPADRAGRVAGLEKVAFVDLPDIESRFEDHLPMVLAVNGEIDGLIVVRTAESSFDATFLEKLQAFRRPQMDLLLVMNKFDDWVAARGSEAEARAVCAEHLAEVLRGLDLSTEDVFMTDARLPDMREGEGFDVERLASRVLQDKSSEELERAKLRAWVFQLRTWTHQVRTAVDLPQGRRALRDVLERCARARDEIEAGGPGVAVDALVAPGIRLGFERFVERGLAGSPQVERSETRLVRRVFHHRVERLPFARLMAAPMVMTGEVLDGLFGRGGAGSPLLPTSDSREADEAVAGLVEAVNETLELDRAALEARFTGVPEGGMLTGEEARRALRTVFHGILDRREEAVCARVRQPWLVYRLAMWLPLAWFLVLRPLTELYLAKGAEWTPELVWATLPTALLRLTTPGYLIAAVATLVLFYGAVLLREYHLAFRAVHEVDRLEGAAKEWAGGLVRDLYREFFGVMIPGRLRRLGQCLDDAGLQLGAVDQGLREIDAEAVHDAERQLEVPAGPE